MKKFKIHSIKYSHYEIIRLLHIESTLTMKDISKKILKHKSTVTALIQKLLKEDYVFTIPCTKDKRITHVNLTPKGKQLKGLINSIEQKLLLKIHQQLSKQEQDTISEKLNTLIAVS